MGSEVDLQKDDAVLEIKTESTLTPESPLPVSYLQHDVFVRRARPKPQDSETRVISLLHNTYGRLSLVDGIREKTLDL